MRPRSLLVVFALISALACGSSSATQADLTPPSTGGPGGTSNTGGQVGTAGVGDGATTALTGFVDKTVLVVGVRYS